MFEVQQILQTWLTGNRQNLTEKKTAFWCHNRQTNPISIALRNTWNMFKMHKIPTANFWVSEEMASNCSDRRWQAQKPTEPVALENLTGIFLCKDSNCFLVILSSRNKRCASKYVCLEMFGGNHVYFAQVGLRYEQAEQLHPAAAIPLFNACFSDKRNSMIFVHFSPGRGSDQKDRKTERQKDRKTERQKDRKTERKKGVTLFHASFSQW